MASPSTQNKLIIAAAGSGKTEYIVNQALNITDKRVLITTYTNENHNQIVSRIKSKAGVIPPNLHVITWCKLLFNQLAKPYQSIITHSPFFIKGINFGLRPDRISKQKLSYYFDRRNYIYNDYLSDFICNVNEKSSNAIISRLENIFSCIFIDEIQDFTGYDLNLIFHFLQSNMRVEMVGDPRQSILSSNNNRKNSQYRGADIMKWFDKHRKHFELVELSQSHRCNKHICMFADSIFPEYKHTVSLNVNDVAHQGIFLVHKSDVQAYLCEFQDVKILRHDKRAKIETSDPINVGKSKGSTYERVLIYTTKPWKEYLIHRDNNKLKSRERLYVAVTRARHSVAFVIDERIKCDIPYYIPNIANEPFTLSNTGY